MPQSNNDQADGTRRGLRAHGSASIAELREFVAQARGKPPQEVLGLIAQSGLARGIVLATLIITLLFVVGTAGPYAWNKMMGHTGQAANAANHSAVKQPAKPDAAAPTTAATEPTEPKTAKTDPKEAILDKLGIGETKTVPKGVNPLEGRTDDILKDLDKK